VLTISIRLLRIRRLASRFSPAFGTTEKPGNFFA
jgi:hypothetical protein